MSSPSWNPPCPKWLEAGRCTMHEAQALRRTMPLQVHCTPSQSALHSQESLYVITGIMPSQQYSGWPAGGSTHLTSALITGAQSARTKNAFIAQGRGSLASIMLDT